MLASEMIKLHIIIKYYNNIKRLYIYFIIIIYIKYLIYLISRYYYKNS